MSWKVDLSKFIIPEAAASDKKLYAYFASSNDIWSGKITYDDAYVEGKGMSLLATADFSYTDGKLTGKTATILARNVEINGARRTGDIGWLVAGSPYDDVIRAEESGMTLRGGGGRDTFDVSKIAGEGTHTVHITDSRAGEDKVIVSKDSSPVRERITQGGEFNFLQNGGTLRTVLGEKGNHYEADFFMENDPNRVEVRFYAGGTQESNFTAVGGDSVKYLLAVVDNNGDVKDHVTLENAAIVYAGNGDEITGSSESDFISAAVNASKGVTLDAGTGGRDTLTGGAGDDVLIAHAGEVTMTGGAGRDAFDVSKVKDGAVVTIVDAKPGEDYIRVKGGDNVILGDIQKDGTMAIQDLEEKSAFLLKHPKNAENYYVADFKDDNFMIRSYGGSETASTIHAVAPDAEGAELYVSVEKNGDVGDLVILQGKETTVVYAGNADTVLGDSIGEKLIAYGAARIYGNGGNDSLIAGMGDGVVLDGGDGDDVLSVMQGHAIVTGGEGRDTFSLSEARDGAFMELTDARLGEDVLKVDKEKDYSVKIMDQDGIMCITDKKTNETAKIKIQETNHYYAVDLTDDNTFARIYAGSRESSHIRAEAAPVEGADLYVNTMSNGETADVVELLGAGMAYAGANDSVLGSDGDDTLMAGFGNVTLTGGAGRDIFDLKRAKVGTHVLMTDFVLGEDVVEVKETGQEKPTDVAKLISADGICKVTDGVQVQMQKYDNYYAMDALAADKLYRIYAARAEGSTILAENNTDARSVGFAVVDTANNGDTGDLVMTASGSSLVAYAGKNDSIMGAEGADDIDVRDQENVLIGLGNNAAGMMDSVEGAILGDELGKSTIFRVYSDMNYEDFRARMDDENIYLLNGQGEMKVERNGETGKTQKLILASSGGVYSSMLLGDVTVDGEAASADGTMVLLGTDRKSAVKGSIVDLSNDDDMMADPLTYINIERAIGSDSKASLLFGRKQKKSVLQAGAAGASIHGGMANDILIGGSGKDTFFVDGMGMGNDVIEGSGHEDKVVMNMKLSDVVDLSYTSFNGKDLLLGFREGGTLTVKDYKLGVGSFELQDATVSYEGNGKFKTTMK